MNKLASAIRTESAAILDPGLDGGAGHEGLQLAAEEWATASLRMFTEDLLDKALDISKAIANYLKELELRVADAVKPK